MDDNGFRDEIFSFPVDFAYESLPEPDQPVCIVSIIGRSIYNPHRQKASIVNAVIGRETFIEYETSARRKKRDCQLECYYSEDKQVLFIHLKTLLDTNDLVAECDKMLECVKKKTSSSEWRKADYYYARALLYIFTVSHIIVLCQPGNAFDVGYVRLFRIIEAIRHKLSPVVKDILSDLDVHKSWQSAGRPCSPRVLFCFPSVTVSHKVPDVSRGKSGSLGPLKKLQHALEDQIYLILRKARIITNISNQSLFAVPANEAFVYVQSRYDTSSHLDIADPIAYYMNKFKAHCSQHKESEEMRSRGASDESLPAVFSGAEFFKKQQLPNTSTPNNFVTFLEHHIELALTKGFDDNIRRNPVQAVFQLESAVKSVQICDALYDFFLYDLQAPERPDLKNMQSLIDIDERFSEARCAKIKNLALSTYREGLPSLYRQEFHLRQLRKAKAVYQQHSRGYATSKYLRMLEEECDALWKSGHQLCEQLSLTENFCALELHRVPGTPVTDNDKDLPEMKHNSKVYTRSTCNCGCYQAERYDPFDHKTGNYVFYKKVSHSCCADLPRYNLPVFKHSIAEAKASPVIRGDSALARRQTRDNKEAEQKEAEQNLEMLMSNLSMGMSLGQSAGPDPYNAVSVETFASELPVIDDPAIIAAEAGTASSPDKTIIKQHSTTEYLSSMPTNHSPPELLPEFSSWSLLVLMDYDEYEPQHGLDQPCFLSGCNYLLPHDVTIKADKDKWPTLEAGGKKSKFKKNIKDKEIPQAEEQDHTLRLYIGFEYECPRGKRFFISSVDKMFKAPLTGVFKETAAPVMDSDLLLYFPCHCRKGCLAQLMRVFVAIPEGPLEVTIYPQVQPAPSPSPAFHLGTDEPAVLDNGKVWVLRLPYVYLDDTGPYVIPNDPDAASACRVYKSMIRVKEVS